MDPRLSAVLQTMKKLEKAPWPLPSGIVIYTGFVRRRPRVVFTNGEILVGVTGEKAQEASFATEALPLVLRRLGR